MRQACESVSLSQADAHSFEDVPPLGQASAYRAAGPDGNPYSRRQEDGTKEPISA